MHILYWKQISIQSSYKVLSSHIWDSTVPDSTELPKIFEQSVVYEILF